MGLLFFIKDIFSNVGLLIIPLFICVSLVFVVFFERLIFFLFVFKKENVMANIKDIVNNNKLYPKQLREDLINIELTEVEGSLESGFGLLKFIGGLATMLGLLGTVIGMIDVFSSIASIKTAVSPSMISGGIKKAMYTTAYGITISIFAITIHYLLSIISNKILLKLEEYSSIINITKEYERISEINKAKKQYGEAA